MKNGVQPLALPALRSHMGDWIYYVSFMKMRDIAERISIAQDIHSSSSLRELLQRKLTSRAGSIRDYLVSQPQRFFNALVVGTYGGDIGWTEIGLKWPEARPSNVGELKGALGILTLSGAEKLFAVDGQHRVAGIRLAIEDKRRLAQEEVAVIFVAAVTQQHRDDDPAGFERTRRLFTTLNRYAKPVNKADIIALDEDDVVAILTRDFVENHPLFREKVTAQYVNSIHPRDRTSFTTITAVYDALNAYLKRPRGWKEFQKFRPQENVIEDFRRRAEELLESLCEVFPPLRHMAKAPVGEAISAEYRSPYGGHLLYRPVGFLMVVRCMRRLIDQGISLTEVLRRLARIPTDLAGQPWVNVIWDPTNKVMLAAGENQSVAERLLLYHLGGDLSGGKFTEEKLRERLAGILKKQTYELPRAYFSTTGV